MLRLSRGQQQKVAVARAFLTRPRLMLLDEPTTGLNARSKRDVQRFVADVRAQGVTILLPTHDMQEAELFCDRIVFLPGGLLVFFFFKIPPPPKISPLPPPDALPI